MAELKRSAPRRARASLSFGTRLGRLLKFFAALAGSGGVGVLALQLVGWFQAGAWTPRSLLDLWLWMGNSYSIGAGGEGDRLALWILGWPLGPTLLAVALGLLLVARAVGR